MPEAASAIPPPHLVRIELRAQQSRVQVQLRAPLLQRHLQVIVAHHRSGLSFRIVDNRAVALDAHRQLDPVTV